MCVRYEAWTSRRRRRRFAISTGIAVSVFAMHTDRALRNHQTTQIYKWQRFAFARMSFSDGHGASASRLPLHIVINIKPPSKVT